MASDRAFRILARSQPNIVEAFVRLVAPDILPPNVAITPESVGDPHLDALSTEIKTDWLVHAGPFDIAHLECQGYPDIAFPDRLIRYHLAGSLSYWDKRVHTLALWLIQPPARQALDLITHGDIQVKVRSIVLQAIPAAALLVDPRTACFAAGADAGAWRADELCARVVAALVQGSATWNQWRFAAVVARMRGRYKEMVKAMQQAKVEPLIVDELILIGIEEGMLQEARDVLLLILDARGFVLEAAEREKILGETSIADLRTWHRRAVTAGSVGEVFAAEVVRGGS